jgi:hypothetical protein
VRVGSIRFRELGRVGVTVIVIIAVLGMYDGVSSTSCLSTSGLPLQSSQNCSLSRLCLLLHVGLYGLFYGQPSTLNNVV